MERNDLVDFTMQLPDGTSFTARTHPGTDMDEVLAMWLIRLRATREWIIQNSQEIDGQRVIFLGVGDASQRGVFNEHEKRDIGRDNSDSCATLVAKALGIIDDPIIQPLLRYGLIEDTTGSQSPFDVPVFLKHARSLGRDNTENIRWGHHALDIWLESRLRSGEQLSEDHQEIYLKMSGSFLNIARLHTAARLMAVESVPNPDEWLNIALDVYHQAELRTAEAAKRTKAWAQPHFVDFAGNRFVYYVLMDDDAFATSGFFRWNTRPTLLFRIESNGRFQIFARGDQRLANEVFDGIIHQLYKNKNLIPDEVLKLTYPEQRRWVRSQQPLDREPYWMHRLYFHPSTGSIFNGSLTAYYQNPLIGDELSVAEICQIINAAILRAKPTTAKPRRRATTPRVDPPTPADPTPPSEPSNPEVAAAA